jgi:hypothetical protein
MTPSKKLCMPLLEKRHIVWKEWSYTFTLRISLQTYFYMTCKDQVFVADVMVIDSTWEMMVMNVISRPVGAIVELTSIVKICNYRKFHEAHHFIPTAMEVHGAFKRDMDCFIKECACLFHDRQSRGNL